MDSIEGCDLENFVFYSVLPEDKGLLAQSDIPKKLKERYGVGIRGVSRSRFHRTLIDQAEKLGIPIKWGHKVIKVEDVGDSVKVTFEGGGTETVSFVVGCDGLHSNVRICLFGAEEAAFTGLVQVRLSSIHCASCRSAHPDCVFRRREASARHRSP